MVRNSWVFDHTTFDEARGKMSLKGEYNLGLNSILLHPPSTPSPCAVKLFIKEDMTKQKIETLPLQSAVMVLLGGEICLLGGNLVPGSARFLGRDEEKSKARNWNRQQPDHLFAQRKLDFGVCVFTGNPKLTPPEVWQRFFFWKVTFAIWKDCLPTTSFSGSMLNFGGV